MGILDANLIIPLDTPLNTVELTHMRIVSFKPELNPPNFWMEFWLVYGLLQIPGDFDSFREYAHPQTAEKARYVKVEDGNHPLRPGTALGKCDICGKWYSTISGECTEGECIGNIAPYDGYSRLVGVATPDGPACVCESMLGCLTNFLCAEIVPDPNDFTQMVKLFPGTPLE